MAEGNVPRGEEIRPVPPGQEDPAVRKGMEQASTALGKEAQARMDKELKALEKVHARHARKAERAAAKAGPEAQALRSELEQVQGGEVRTEEEARAVRRRTQEVAERHRPSYVAALKAAGIDRETLASEIMASVALPDHARAVGRRAKDEGTGSLGWTTEVEG